MYHIKTMITILSDCCTCTINNLSVNICHVCRVLNYQRDRFSYIRTFLLGTNACTCSDSKPKTQKLYRC